MRCHYAMIVRHNDAMSVSVYHTYAELRAAVFGAMRDALVISRSVTVMNGDEMQTFVRGFANGDVIAITSSLINADAEKKFVIISFYA